MSKQQLGRIGTILSLACSVAVLSGAGVHDNDHPSGTTTALQASSGRTTTDIAPSDAGEPRVRALSRDANRQTLVKNRETALLREAQRLRREREDVLKQEASLASERDAQLVRQTGWVRPLESFRVTSRFGSSGSLWSNDHTGLDFAASQGSPIRSVTPGTVVEAGDAGAYGLRTIVRTDDGAELWYCHQSRVDVSAGDVVTPGQEIGAVGATGNVTGPHLHLEVRPGGGDPVDPEAALRAQGVAF